MSRTEVDTLVKDANPNDRSLTRGGVNEERPACLVCGAHIGRRDPTIEIRGALVHMHCAAYRRRLVRR